MKKSITIGMAGAGRATELHMEAYKHVKDINLNFKTIIANHFENAERAKERYGFSFASTNYEDLINDPEIDVIDICTPPYTHEDMIIRALCAVGGGVKVNT